MRRYIVLHVDGRVFLFTICVLCILRSTYCFQISTEITSASLCCVRRARIVLRIFRSAVFNVCDALRLLLALTFRLLTVPIKFHRNQINCKRSFSRCHILLILRTAQPYVKGSSYHRISSFVHAGRSQFRSKFFLSQNDTFRTKENRTKVVRTTEIVKVSNVIGLIALSVSYPLYAGKKIAFSSHHSDTTTSQRWMYTFPVF